MDWFGLVHTVFSVSALLAGGYVFLIAKGTRRHVTIGKVYVGSMIVLLFTSFFIFDLFGGFGVFHVMALVSIVTLGLGMYAAVFGRDSEGWLVGHYMWMSYSYVGLVMAAGSHLFGAFPDLPWWLAVFLFWGLPYGVGSYLIFSLRKSILAETSRRKKLSVTVK